MISFFAILLLFPPLIGNAQNISSSGDCNVNAPANQGSLTINFGTGCGNFPGLIPYSDGKNILTFQYPKAFEYVAPLDGPLYGFVIHNRTLVPDKFIELHVKKVFRRALKPSEFQDYINRANRLKEKGGQHCNPFEDRFIPYNNEVLSNQFVSLEKRIAFFIKKLIPPFPLNLFGEETVILCRIDEEDGWVMNAEVFLTKNEYDHFGNEALDSLRSIKWSSKEARHYLSEECDTEENSLICKYW